MILDLTNKYVLSWYIDDSKEHLACTKRYSKWSLCKYYFYFKQQQNTLPECFLDVTVSNSFYNLVFHQLVVYQSMLYRPFKVFLLQDNLNAELNMITKTEYKIGYINFFK